jgi:hypothetical protein
MKGDFDMVYTEEQCKRLLEECGMENTIRKPTKKLYQYRNGKSEDGHIYDIDNLYDNKVWASAACYFNDPYDCSLLLNTDIYGEEDRNYLQECMKTTSRSIAKYCFVSCFSEKNKSLCMWAYYANNHQGFCVEYEKKSLKNVFPINYNNEILPFNCNLSFDKLVFKSALNKSEDWVHEREWRMLSYRKVTEVPQKGILLESCKPTKIYLGCKINNNLEEAISQYCKKEKVDLDRMEMSTTRYELIPQKVFKF